jgi:hypothetical protein
MSTGFNQEEALALWRADGSRDDPAPYTVQRRHGRPFVWMSVYGNVGWYAPELNPAGEMVGIRSEASPQPNAREDAETRHLLNWQFKLINPKQRRKLAHLIALNQKP